MTSRVSWRRQRPPPTADRGGRPARARGTPRRGRRHGLRLLRDRFHTGLLLRTGPLVARPDDRLGAAPVSALRQAGIR